MKNLKVYISLCTIILTMTISAQEKTESILQVTRKAKADLVKVLSETGDQFNFGIKVNDVKNSREASPMGYYEMDFESLLNYGGQQPMGNMLKTEVKKIVPLVSENSVITTVSVSNNKQGAYEVTELINHQYHKELNELPENIKQDDFKRLKIIYVPNLPTTIYHLDGKNYTSYKGRSLREGVDDVTLLQLLKNDANIFQSKYGSQLINGTLLD